MAEFNVGGQRVVVDTSDSPSPEELQRRIEEALAAETAPAPPPAEAVVQETQQPVATVQETPVADGATPVQQEQSGWDTFVDNVSEIPEGVASGATKALANTSILADNLTGGYLSAASDWLNDNVANLGYLHIDYNSGRVYWTSDKVDPTTQAGMEDAVTVFDTTTVTGDLVEGVSQFATGLVMTRGAGMTGTTATALAGQAVVAENLAFNPHEARLSNLVQSFPSLENPVTEFLAADPEDSEALARFKMSIEALGLEAAGAAIFASVKAYRNYSRGLEADPEDVAAVQQWVDSQAPDVNVSIGELDAKMAQAVDAEAQLRATYAAADRNAHILSPETVAQIKAGARATGIDQTPDTLVERGQQLYGYGVTKTNDQLVRQADDVIAEAFVDSPSVMKGIENLKASLSTKDFDIYVTAAGRVLQMTTRNMAEAHRGLKSAEAELRQAFDQLNARTDLAPDEMVTMKAELQENFLAHQNLYRQVRNDYIESVMAFRGGATTAGRAVQVNRLFQNFDVAPQDVEAHFDRLLRSLPNEKVRNSFVARAVFALNDKTTTILKALDEIFIANILTGFKTHVVNTVGNTAHTIYLPMERAVAGGVRVLMGDVKGGTETFQRAMAQFTGMRHAMVESSKLAVEAYRIGDTLLDNSNTYEMQGRAVIGRDLPMDKQTLTELGKFITLRESEITLADLMGTAMRAMSTRALATEDEFFKNLNFRSRVYGDAYVDGLKTAQAQGLTGAEARAFAGSYATDSVQRASTEQMMLSRNGMPTDLGVENYRSDALQYARESTFTQGLGKGGASFQNMVEQVPFMRQVFPFVRTPLNLISASVQRSPLAPLSGRWWKDFQAGGERKAVAMTRLAIGSSIVANFMLDFEDGQFKFDPAGKGEMQFTGPGPMQVGARQNAQEIQGVIFGSVIGPDGTQYQISRFDPFSTLFEAIGVIQDLHRSGRVEEADNLVLAHSMSIAQMLANDTYASSVRQLMFAMQSEDGFKKFMLSRAGQLVPLSGFSKGYNQVNDPFQREIRNLHDSLMGSLPGYSEALPPRYNLLGEAVDQVPFATLGLFPEGIETMMSPVMSGQVKTDVVAVEFANQNITTIKQSPFLKGGVIDLNDERYATDALGEPLYEANRSAYDRFNDIMANERLFGNLTLREFLEKTINSAAYQNRMTDSVRVDTPTGRKASVMYEGSRADILTAIVADAKEYALMRLRKENPALDAALQLHDLNTANAMTPRGQAQMQNLNAPLEGN